MTRYTIATLLTLISVEGFSDEGIALQQFLKSESVAELVHLDRTYRGSFTTRFGDSELAFDDKPFTIITGAISRSANSTRKYVRSLTVVTANRDEEGAPIYGADAVQLPELPPFDELIAITSIREFEAVFGKHQGLELVYAGGTIRRNGVTYKVPKRKRLSWQGFVVDESGSIRVVLVFVDAFDRGKGWEIGDRQMREGVFDPKNSALNDREEAEPSIEPKPTAQSN